MIDYLVDDRTTQKSYLKLLTPAMENNLTLDHQDHDFEAIAKHTVLKQKKLNFNNIDNTSVNPPKKIQNCEKMIFIADK